MPTTTATLSLTNDISSVPVNVSASFDLLKAGSSEGMDEMKSVRKVLKSTNQVDLIIDAAAATAGHSFVYLSNASTVSTDFITVTLGAAGGGSPTIVEEIGRLYAGDWMFIPWNGVDDTGDIIVKPNTANEMPIEFILIV
jgi:hypothetical protein